MTFIETSNLAGAALGIRNGNTPWTVERELTVRRLWKAGWSAGEISLELGSTTRNAVIGKLHRFGLTKGDRAEGVTLKCSPAARVAGAKVQRRPDGFRRMPDKRTQSAVQQLFVAPAPKPAPDTPPDQRVPLLDLTAKSCRFPIGDPCKPDFGFCTAEHLYGLPYCGFHARICYQAPAARTDRRGRI